MYWLFLAAGLIPLPRPDANEARIVLVRAELHNVDGPGLARFDQAVMAFAHTDKELKPVLEPGLGACTAGEAPAEQVQGYLAGAAPVLASQLPGTGIRLVETPKLLSQGQVRSVPALSGGAGLYASTLGGSRRGVASERPLFFGEGSIGLQVNSKELGIAPPRYFVWPQRDMVLRQPRAKALSVKWQQATDGEVVLVLSAAHADRSAKWIVCRASAARGGFVIPSRLLLALPPSENATLLLIWAPSKAWQDIRITGFSQAWVASFHVQGASLALLR